ncbi:MAG TPA: DNA mismatch repair protein MutS, partial [candidate division Zixibacteria bacterium]|nr:DNA mismatch repair protein MutS [candidate division Zixibacteria bacterium]
KQYYQIKNRFPDKILFFRMGDFYEMFGEDAERAAPVLGIALTSRAHGKQERVPLAGVPYHQAEKYLAKLLDAGFKVVICEQTEDPKKAKGLVRREAVEIVTPGTSLYERTEKGTANFLAGVVFNKERVGFARLDLSTGEFVIGESDESGWSETFLSLEPTEVVFPQSQKEQVAHFPELSAGRTLSPVEDWKFDFGWAHKNLSEKLGTLNLSGFGVEDKMLAVSAAGGVLSYLSENQLQRLEHLRVIRPLSDSDEASLDFSTLLHLEIFRTPSGDKINTLFVHLDRTATAQGSRRLGRWLRTPLVNPAKIKERLDRVESLVKDHFLRKKLHNLLSEVADLQKLAAKLGMGKAGPRDLVAIKNSIGFLPEIAALLRESGPPLYEFLIHFSDLSGLFKLLDTALKNEPPLAVNQGGIIKPGYSAELDQLHAGISDAKKWIATLQSAERQRTGIPSLKVGYNKVFGYYIEVTTPHKDKVPSDYIRKQTLVNAERFITEELKEKEELILTAEEKIFAVEEQLFREVEEKSRAFVAPLLESAEGTALIDAAVALAIVAVDEHYIRPEVVEDGETVIEESRHPVLEKVLPKGNLVPNDVSFAQERPIAILTGPNMAGKSTYLRQTGILFLLAQIGSFVPARKAKVRIADKIYTRVGASDDILRHRSTFLVEMSEVANILNNATSGSLILLDEIGRGTSTYDGLSIAYGLVEYLAAFPKGAPRTLFATHYHELVELERKLPCVTNLQVEVKEFEHQLIFLHKIIPGGCDRSFGIEVAKLAGVPVKLVERARQLLKELESERIRLNVPVDQPSEAELSDVKPFFEKILKLEPDRLTPLEALFLINELKKEIQKLTREFGWK